MRLVQFTCVLALVFATLNLPAQKRDYDLKHWPKGASPAEVGKKMVVKFIHTPHSRYGNTRPSTPIIWCATALLR